MEQIEQAAIELEVAGLEDVFRVPEQADHPAHGRDAFDDLAAESECRVGRKVEVVVAQERAVVQHERDF